jgi:hypothetical protein
MAVETKVRRMIKAALKTNVVLTVRIKGTALAAAGEEDEEKVLEQSNASNRKSLKGPETWRNQQVSPQELVLHAGNFPEDTPFGIISARSRVSEYMIESRPFTFTSTSSRYIRLTFHVNPKLQTKEVSSSEHPPSVCLTMRATYRD